MDQSTLHFIYFLAVVGGIWFVIAISSCIWTLIRLLLPRKDLIYDYGQDTWAVVTGASDGIGLAFAKQLAKEKFNICLIGRNRKKLEAAQSQIKQITSEVKTCIVVADFVDSQKQGFFERITDELKPLQISILVNNAGIANMGRFQQIAFGRLIEQINVNCVPTACLTNLLVTSMLTRPHRSAIISVSSTAALFPCPFTANYSGTKGFGTMLSKGIQLQFQDKIDTLCVQPMVVQTKLSQQSGRWDIVSAEQCAKSSLNALGYNAVTKGHWKHRFIAWFSSKLPTIITNAVTKSVMAKALKISDKSYD